MWWWWSLVSVLYRMSRCYYNIKHSIQLIEQISSLPYICLRLSIYRQYVYRKLKNPTVKLFSSKRNFTPVNLVSDLTGLSVYTTPPRCCLVFAPPPMFSLLRAPLCLLLAGSCDREGYSARGKRRLNMFWWGMWENSRVHLYIHQPACQPSSRPSRPLSAWTRAAFVPHLPATPCPAPAPHRTLLSILSHLLCLPLFTRRPSPQNSTAGPLWT